MKLRYGKQFIPTWTLKAMLSWDCGRRCPILARMSAQQFPSGRMFQLHFPLSNHKQMNIIHNCCILRKLTVSLFNSRSNIQRIRIANELSKPFVLHQLKTRVNMQTFYFDVFSWNQVQPWITKATAIHIENNNTWITLKLRTGYQAPTKNCCISWRKLWRSLPC